MTCRGCRSSRAGPAVIACLALTVSIYRETSPNYNKAINEGKFPDRKSNDYQAQLADFVNGYKKTFKESEWASQCMDCEACLPKCPQQIRIPNQMSRIVELVGNAGG